jgi:hypothetical protein
MSGLLSSWDEHGTPDPLGQLYKLRNTKTGEIFWACDTGAHQSDAFILLPAGDKRVVKRDYRKENGREFTLYTYEQGLYEFAGWARD